MMLSFNQEAQNLNQSYAFFKTVIPKKNSQLTSNLHGHKKWKVPWAQKRLTQALTITAKKNWSSSFQLTNSSLFN